VSLIKLAVTLVLVAGCTDNEASDDQLRTMVPQVTPQAPAIIDGQNFFSVASGYGVEYPEGWVPDDNFLFTQQTVTDVFFAPPQGEGAQGNIQVRCDRDTGALTEQQFVDARITAAQGFALGDVQQDVTSVAGVPAVRLRYQQAPSPTVTVAKLDIIFFSHGCGWTITLTQGLSQDYSEQFATLLNSFRFAG
jgi:hypothetical protein